MNRRKFLLTSLAAGGMLTSSQVNAWNKPKCKPKLKLLNHLDPASQQIIDKFLSEMATGGVYDFVLMWRYREDDPYFFGDAQDIMSGAIGEEVVENANL